MVSTVFYIEELCRLVLRPVDNGIKQGPVLLSIQVSHACDAPNHSSNQNLGGCHRFLSYHTVFRGDIKSI